MSQKYGKITRFETLEMTDFSYETQNEVTRLLARICEENWGSSLEGKIRSQMEQ